MGVAREMALASSTVFALEVGNTKIHGMTLKCQVLIVIKTGTKGVCIHNALGLVRTVRLDHGSNGPGIGLPAHTRPRALWQPIQNRS